MLRIDAHHHLWRFKAEEYSWISPEMSVLRRDFGPEHLQAELTAAGVAFAVTIQARQSLEETRFLLNAARSHSFIKGVVGWVPLTDADVVMDLERFATDANLRGVRHVLHDEPDDNFMLREDFNRGIRALRSFNLAYDVLIFGRHLPQTIEFVDRHPSQRFVVDHLAKPCVRDNEISPWREWLEELAKRPHVYCKISGLATEADHASWTGAQLSVYMDVVLNAFGPKRVMFGSDWPVCLLAISYSDWTKLVSAQITRLSEAEQARIWSGTAIEAYSLTV